MRCLVVLLLAGCATQAGYTSIDYGRAPPADWPKLREHLYRVTQDDLQRHCARSPDAGPDLRGCHGFNFADGWCAIFLALGHDALLEHERGHCAGYDHPGETSTRDAWERYKASRR